MLADARLDWGRAVRRKDAIVAEIVEHDERLYRESGIELVRGDAHFSGELEIEIGDRRLRAERVVIATGSAPVIPDVPGLRNAAITSDDAVVLAEPPARAVVLGGGPVGVEFAQLFRSAGATVTLADRGEHLVDIEEPDVTDALLKALRASGVDVRMGTELASVSRSGAGYLVRLGNGTEHHVDLVLAAAGRMPRIDCLALERTGVKTGKRGVTVDGALRTSHERIWAAGDVIGGLLYTHVAAYEGRLAGRNAFAPRPTPVDLDGIPRITFADPPLAGVGIGEADARRRGIDAATVRVALDGLGRALIEGWEGGSLALVADRKDGRLLGASMWGPQADSEHGPIDITTATIDGKRTMVAFSGEQSLSRWKPTGSAYARLPALTTLELFVREGFEQLVIDRAGPATLRITPAQARHLLAEQEA